MTAQADSRGQRKVLKVAVGAGANFPFYDRGVEITAVDFSPEMLRKQKRPQRSTEFGRISSSPTLSASPFLPNLSTLWSQPCHCADTKIPSRC